MACFQKVAVLRRNMLSFSYLYVLRIFCKQEGDVQSWLFSFNKKPISLVFHAFQF